MTPITLTGHFTRLEPLALEHVPGLLAAAAVRDTYGLTFVPADEPGMRAYVEAAMADQARGAAVPFATVDAQTGQVVGSTRFGGLEYWTWPDGRQARAGVDAPDAAEIGWTWLAAHAQRTPINTDAKLLMLWHAFETWKVQRVHLKTDARNARSRAAIERLGARLDGELRGHMPAADGGVRVSAWYSILPDEWPAVKERLLRRLDPDRFRRP